MITLIYVRKTVEQTIETPVIWDAIALIMTSGTNMNQLKTGVRAWIGNLIPTKDGISSFFHVITIIPQKVMTYPPPGTISQRVYEFIIQISSENISLLNEN